MANPRPLRLTVTLAVPAISPIRRPAGCRVGTVLRERELCIELERFETLRAGLTIYDRESEKDEGNGRSRIEVAMSSQLNTP